MESNEANNANSTFCKICAENGYPNVEIYWKHVPKEDGTTGWAPCKDKERNVRHTHMHLEPKPSMETRESIENWTNKETPPADQQEPLSESEIIQTLLNIHQLSQQHNRILKGLLETLGYLE